MDNVMLSPIVQYGFAGLAAAQLAIIFWMVRRVMDSFDRNTAAYQRLVAMLDARPCLNGDRALRDRDR